MLPGFHQVTAVTLAPADLGPTAELEREELITRLIADAHLAYERKEKELSETEGLDDDIMRPLERFFLLQVIDAHWREHLDSMDYLREGIHLRSMAQKDPLVEDKVEGHQMFQEMMEQGRTEGVLVLSHAHIDVGEDLVPMHAAQGGQLNDEHGDHSALDDARVYGPETGSASS